jgi:hypothetical protein
VEQLSAKLLPSYTWIQVDSLPMRDIVNDISKTTAFIQAFQDKSLPKSAWTHEAHFVTALWHIREYGFDDAVERMRTGIKSYNEAVGGKNTDTDGYHETITLLYLDALADFLSRNSDATATELFERLLDDDIIDRAYPLQFYSKQVLFSREARRTWVAPDLLSPEFLRR